MRDDTLSDDQRMGKGQMVGLLRKRLALEPQQDRLV